MECSEISFLRSHSEQIPQKSTILGSRNFWKRIRWDSKEPYEMITKLDIRPVLFILHYFFHFLLSAVYGSQGLLQSMFINF